MTALINEITRTISRPSIYLSVGRELGKPLVCSHIFRLGKIVVVKGKNLDANLRCSLPISIFRHAQVLCCIRQNLPVGACCQHLDASRQQRWRCHKEFHNDVLTSDGTHARYAYVGSGLVSPEGIRKWSESVWGCEGEKAMMVMMMGLLDIMALIGIP